MDFTIKHKGYNITYIDSQFKLLECIQHLNSCDEIGFDIEFDKDMYMYGFNICLVQVATRNRCFVIDPLKDIDLAPLFEVFENINILKVASAPDQDIRLLHTLKCYPKSIFDTDTAARLLNYEFTSIGKLVAQKFDVQLDKKLQTSNWGQRPLSIDQIKYSVDDVIYLLKLKKELVGEAREKGIEEWLNDERRYLDQISYDTTEDKDFLSKDDKKMSAYYQYVLNELLTFRDSTAQKLKKPCNSVIVKSLMVDIANEVVNISDWLNLKGMIYSIKNEQFKAEIQEFYDRVVAEAHQMGLSKLPSNIKMTKEERDELNRQKAYIEEMKATVFAPIQQLLVQDHGEFAARYILSNAKVTELIKDEGKVSEMKISYRKNLIIANAEKLNIDLGVFR